MAIAFVNGSQTAETTAGTSFNISTTASAGNALVVVVSSITATVTEITDAVGNAYTQVIAANNGTSAHVEVWVSRNIKALSAQNVTIALSASAKCTICIAQYSGVKGVGCTATTGSGNFNTTSGTGTVSPTTATLTVTDTGCFMVLGTSCAGTGTQSANTGNLRETAATTGASSVGGALADNSGATSDTCKTTISASESWVAAGIELLDVAICGADEVQHAFTQAAAGASGTVQLGANPTAGNLIVVCVVTDGTVTSVTDNNSNTYTLVTSQVLSGANGYMYYAKNIATTPNANPTITVNLSPSAAFTWNIQEIELSGCDTAAPLDQSGAATGSSATPTSANVTTTQASEIMIGLLGSGTNTSMLNGNGWMMAAYNHPGSTSVSLFKQVNATQTGVNANGTMPAAHSWIALIGTFKTASTLIAMDWTEPTEQQFLDATLRLAMLSEYDDRSFPIILPPPAWDAEPFAEQQFKTDKYTPFDLSQLAEDWTRFIIIPTLSWPDEHEHARNLDLNLAVMWEEDRALIVLPAGFYDDIFKDFLQTDLTTWVAKFGKLEEEDRNQLMFPPPTPADDTVQEAHERTYIQDSDDWRDDWAGRFVQPPPPVFDPAQFPQQISDEIAGRLNNQFGSDESEDFAARFFTIPGVVQDVDNEQQKPWEGWTAQRVEYDDVTFAAVVITPPFDPSLGTAYDADLDAHDVSYHWHHDEDYWQPNNPILPPLPPLEDDPHDFFPFQTLFAANMGIFWYVEEQANRVLVIVIGGPVTGKSARFWDNLGKGGSRR